jgi:protein-tyrosine phosphatase
VYAAVPDRHLPLAGTYNLRDVGGYPTAGGGTTRWRTLLRGDALHRLDDDGWGTLGVRTVVDLREDAEHDLAPHVVGGHPVVVRRMPLLDRLGSLPKGWTLADLYLRVVDERGPRLAATVGALAEPGALPAVVHCTAGKDRTGIVVALVLSAVGVDDDTIAQDYALTAQYLTGGYVAEARERMQRMDRQGGGSNTAAHFSCEPELILAVLARVRELSGDAGTYLVGHGLPDAHLAGLRAALVEGPAV